MRTWIYRVLVNKQAGISQRYHKVHDGSTGMDRFLSYVWLLWLNLAYYVFFCRWLGQPLDAPVYEEKRLLVDRPENSLAKCLPIEELVRQLLPYDVISFDIFDTLIFRPFSEPTDLFYILGQELGYMDFKRIRMEAEARARSRKFEDCGSFEVNLKEIWQQLEEMTGLNAESGARREIDAECKLCYANPYMYEVFWSLQQAGKYIVITSDMYLPGSMLDILLKKCGYDGYEKLFVSCDRQKSKGDGKLFDYVRQQCGGQKSFAHVGDNKISDVKMARKHGFTPFLYPNVNNNSLLYRAYDMSPIVGGAYRGLVNNRIYHGLCQENQNWEYGYIYGGLFVLGYCHFIHEYCVSHGVDKILFLARDGEVLQKAYRILYPGEETGYAYLSRLAAAKLSAGYFKYDYLRKMVWHKTGKGYTLAEILKTMELSGLERFLPDFVPILLPSDRLTSKNVQNFIDFINENWQKVLTIYASQREAAGIWYRNLLGQAKKAVAVDIGWAGSGALTLKTLFEQEWHIDCELTGIVAGTNTLHNAEPDMSETMLLDKTLASYLYSSGDNRDLWKKHNPARMYNVYFELLTSSATPSFKGFYFGKSGQVELAFRESEQNPRGIREIQKGILDFVEDYKEHFADYPYMFSVSGRDAYAPMLLAAGCKERYLRHINMEFDLSIGV